MSTIITRGFLILAVLSVLLLSYEVRGGTAVEAGTYSVTQCDYERAITNNSFVWNSSGVPAPLQHANSGCSEFGLAARSSGVGTARTYPDGSHGSYIATAPEGTVFTRFSGEFGTLANCCITGMEAYGQTRNIVQGIGGYDEIFAGPLGASTWSTPSGTEGPVAVTWTAADAESNARQISYGLRCVNAAGCGQSITGDIRVRGRTFEFALEDYQRPVITDVGGDIVDDGWISGVRGLTLAATDEGGGLAGTRVMLGGHSIIDAPITCSETGGRYIELRPCPLSHSATWEIDTREVDDGVVELRLGAEDVGGVVAEETRLIQIDNNAPSAPDDPALDGTQDWRRDNDFTVLWNDVEVQHAPVARMHFGLCELPNMVCELGSHSGDPEGVGRFTVPRPGVFSLRLWLEDAAGNVDVSAPSSEVLLKFDDGVPGRARLQIPEGWLNAADAEAVRVSVGLPSDESQTPSGVAGYSLTADGSLPDSSIDISGPIVDYDLGQVSEGRTTVNARTISGAQVPAASIGTASIKVDRSPPVVDSEGLPGPHDWSRGAALIRLVSADQAGLSGVDPAPVTSPVDDGGWFALRVNGEPLQRVRGDRAAIVLSNDGAHTLTYRAFDAAGNGSVQKEAVVRIDGTAPVGAFRALDPGDPRELRVDVADATSGVAEGWIEYRREGESRYRRLATTLGSGILSTRMDDEALPAGRYEVRALVVDVAGNEAVIDKWADGSAMKLAMPLRLGAAVEVAGSAKVKRCAKAVRRGRARKHSRRPKCRRAPQAKISLELGHGKGALSDGRLTTSQGAAIPGAAMIVEGQARSGGAFVRIGTTRTDAHGRFRFRIPAGPSRTIRYRYDGTNTVRSASATLTTKVRAAARLKVDRRRLHNGQVVRFSGRLLGKPIPAGGKVVALQAKVDRKWRTFANPRANAKGVFKHRYRFTSTTGLRRYAFRAVVAREAAYPYERGVSPVVRVTVRGQ